MVLKKIFALDSPDPRPMSETTKAMSLYSWWVTIQCMATIITNVLTVYMHHPALQSAMTFDPTTIVVCKLYNITELKLHTYGMQG